MKTTWAQLKSEQDFKRGNSAKNSSNMIQKNIEIMQERKIEAVVEMARNALFDRYEDVISEKNANKS